MYRDVSLADKQNEARELALDKLHIVFQERRRSLIQQFQEAKAKGELSEKQLAFYEEINCILNTDTADKEVSKKNDTWFSGFMEPPRIHRRLINERRKKYFLLNDSLPGRLTIPKDFDELSDAEKAYKIEDYLVIRHILSGEASSHYQEAGINPELIMRAILNKSPGNGNATDSNSPNQADIKLWQNEDLRTARNILAARAFQLLSLAYLLSAAFSLKKCKEGESTWVDEWETPSGVISRSFESASPNASFALGAFAAATVIAGLSFIAIVAASEMTEVQYKLKKLEKAIVDSINEEGDQSELLSKKYLAYLLWEELSKYGAQFHKLRTVKPVEGVDLFTYLEAISGVDLAELEKTIEQQSRKDQSDLSIVTEALRQKISALFKNESQPATEIIENPILPEEKSKVRVVYVVEKNPAEIETDAKLEEELEATLGDETEESNSVFER